MILDSDLAAIYGVTTGRLNEAVKRAMIASMSSTVKLIMNSRVDGLIWSLELAKAIQDTLGGWPGAS